MNEGMQTSSELALAQRWGKSAGRFCASERGEHRHRASIRSTRWMDQGGRHAAVLTVKHVLH
eukprot:5716454-Amphidinium_carterae.1